MNNQLKVYKLGALSNSQIIRLIYGSGIVTVYNVETNERAELIIPDRIYEALSKFLEEKT